MIIRILEILLLLGILIYASYKVIFSTEKKEEKLDTTSEDFSEDELEGLILKLQTKLAEEKEKAEQGQVEAKKRYALFQARLKRAEELKEKHSL
jgi:hypothetical protein